MNLPVSVDRVDFDGPALYRIRVSGHLDERWRERAGGLEMTFRDDPGSPPQTELTGRVADQAALMGILQNLYARGVTIVRVERLTRGGSYRDEPVSAGLHRREDADDEDE